MPSVFLRHSPEYLHATVVAVGEGNVIVFSYFFEQLIPLVLGFIGKSKDQCRPGFLCRRRVDDFLYANAKTLVGVWGGCCRGICHGKIILGLLYEHTAIQGLFFRGKFIGSNLPRLLPASWHSHTKNHQLAYGTESQGGTDLSTCR